MYMGNRRPHSVPKDDWGYHVDATEIPLSFIPFLFASLGSVVSPQEAAEIISCSVHEEYFTVRIPGTASNLRFTPTLDQCIEDVIKEQPSRLISMTTDEENTIHMLFIRELRVEARIAFK